MKYTREQLEKMSDADVDKELAQKLGFKVEQHSIVNIGLQWCIVDEDGSLCRIKKYCSNWSDIMPLAVEHKLIINLNLGTGAGVDSKGVTHLCSDYNKPQRAIACCLLMMELK
jgi:hypothetical protein